MKPQRSFWSRPFTKGGPSLNLILYFLLCLYIIYILTHLITEVNERTRESLLLFSLFGFLMASYSYEPVRRILKLAPYKLIFVSIAVVGVCVYVSFLNNDLINGLLKMLFAGSGAAFYLYLKLLFFKLEDKNAGDN